jgi:hypothetical protein
MDYLAEIREFHRLNIEPHLGKPVGCTEAEVNAVEADAGFELPLAYKQYLLWMGKDYYGVFIGSDWHLRWLAANNQSLPRFLARHGLSAYLPEHYFTCFSHQGYSYVWFELPKLAEDPPIWYFNEAMIDDPEAFSKPVDGKPQQWGTFTEVLLNNLQRAASIIHISAPHTLAIRQSALTGLPVTYNGVTYHSKKYNPDE